MDIVAAERTKLVDKHGVWMIDHFAAECCPNGKDGISFGVSG